MKPYSYRRTGSPEKTITRSQTTQTRRRFLQKSAALAAAPGVLLGGCATRSRGDSDGDSTASSLMAHWKFDGSLKDEKGNYTGVFSTGRPVFEPGRLGQALRLNGIDQYVTIPHSEDFNFPGSFSISAWFKAESFEKGWAPVISKGDGSWRLQRDQYNNTMCLDFTLASNQEVRQAVSTELADDNTWHHLVGLYDASASSIRIYFDGRMDGENHVDGRVNPSVQPVAIGENLNPHPMKRNFKGVIDDIRIYTRALRGAEVSKLYQGVGA